MQSSGGSLNCGSFAGYIGHLILEPKVKFVSIYLIMLSIAHTVKRNDRKTFSRMWKTEVVAVLAVACI